jgi:deoxyribonuclease-4
MPRLGAHVSVAGGLAQAVGRAEALGCDSLQIFVKNPSGWVGKPLAESEAAAFRKAARVSGIEPVAHSTYLINLAANDPLTLARSRAALADELARCTRLGIAGLVLHPGAHVGAGEAAGLAQVAASLEAVLAAQPAATTRVWLENTAGQGSTLGYRLEQLAAILKAVSAPDRLGICLDTCHAFAAGYALHTGDGYEAFWDEVDRTLGLARVACLHLNDSQHPLGSRKDRHANIGSGYLGLDCFARLVHDPRLAALPMVLETPLGADGQGHARDLAQLRAL